MILEGVTTGISVLLIHHINKHNYFIRWTTVYFKEKHWKHALTRLNRQQKADTDDVVLSFIAVEERLHSAVHYREIYNVDSASDNFNLAKVTHHLLTEWDYWRGRGWLTWVCYCYRGFAFTCILADKSVKRQIMT